MAWCFVYYPLEDGELQKSFYKERNWSDLHFRNNMLVVYIKGKRERQQEFGSHCSRPLGEATRSWDGKESTNLVTGSED